MNKITVTIATTLLLSLMSACSGGISNPPVSEQQRDVIGAVTKGPVAGAAISVFRFDQAGNPFGGPLATTSTNASGQFTVSGLPGGEPYLVVSSGGTFRDEADKERERTVTLMPGEGFESILPAGASAVALNAYTQAFVDKTRLEAPGSSFLALIDSNRDIFVEAFGFDVLTTIAGDPVAPGGNSAQRNYAMVLGGGAVAMNAISAAVGEQALSWEVIRVFATDLSDGRLDGFQDGNQLTAGPSAQPVPDVDLNLSTRRFRNNNDSVYAGNAPVEVDEFVLSQAGQPDPTANRAPEVSDDGYVISEGGSLNVNSPGVLANDSDADGQDLEAEVLVEPMQSSGFALDESGGFTYVHNGTETLSDSFTYSARDDFGATSMATVSITITPVNDSPVVQKNAPLSVDPGFSIALSSASLDASDADNPAGDLSYSQTAAPACGSFELSGGPSTSFSQADVNGGLVSFNSAGCAGDEILSANFDLTDGAGGGPVALTVRIDVNGASNQAPVNTVPSGPVSVSTSAATSITGFAVNDADADPASDNFTVSLTASGGIVTLRTDVAGGLTSGDLGGTNGSGAVTINAPLNRINASFGAADGLRYRANPGSTGNSALMINSNDNGASGSGGAQADSDALNLVVRRYGLGMQLPGASVRLDGEGAKLRVGEELTGIGDFNNDGFDDLLIAQGKDAGEKAYVVFGRSGLTVSTESLGLIGNNGGELDGFYIDYGVDSSRFGRGVGSGDVNADGISDLIISAEREDGDSGPTYVLFGTATPPTGGFDLDTLNGSNGFVIESSLDDIHLGSDLISGGDVNGDGIDDIVIGAHNAEINGEQKAGAAFVVFGSGAPFPASFSLDGLDGSNGVRINGFERYARVGEAVALADVDADGVMDAVLGAPRSEPGNVSNAGAVYVVFSTAIAAGNSEIDLATLNAAQGLIIEGETQDAQLGRSVSGIADLNGDGQMDLAFSQAGPGGTAFVLYGSAALPPTIAPSALNGSNGFRIINSGPSSARFGSDVAGAGDFNNDGTADLLISDTLASPETNGSTLDSAGEAYIVYGRSAADGPFAATLDVAGDNGTNVLWIPGELEDGELGQSIDVIGDFDGNGRPDIALSAHRARISGEADAGAVYLLFSF